MSTAAYWNYPTEIVCGAGATADLAAWCRRAGGEAPLIVTDPGVAALPFFAALAADLSAAFPRSAVFSDVHANPTFADVARGAAAFAARGHDLVVAIGGGSAIDAAKGIALAAGGLERLAAFEWSKALEAFPTLSDFPRLGLPRLIVVPTTAGTGSELSREAVLVDEAAQVKRVITHAELLAFAVLLDPLPTIGLPPHLTAATGMDALVHHIEAFTSPLAHPMSEAIALEGIRLVGLHLPVACRDGGNVAAREGMLVASAMAAVAFQKGLGGVHALAHPLGARHGLHHGLLNAVLLPYVLLANRPAIEERMIRLGRWLGLAEPGFDTVFTWIMALRTEVGIPGDLAALGLDETEAAWVGEKAVEDISSSETNARPLTADDYARIYRAAVAGRLVAD